MMKEAEYVKSEIEYIKKMGANHVDVTVDSLIPWLEFVIREAYRNGYEYGKNDHSQEQTILIRQALDASGYLDMEPTEENLRKCFSDYVDCGFWRDIELEDIESLSIADMCKGLIRYCR